MLGQPYCQCARGGFCPWTHHVTWPIGPDSELSVSDDTDPTISCLSAEEWVDTQNLSSSPQWQLLQLGRPNWTHGLLPSLLFMFWPSSLTGRWWDSQPVRLVTGWPVYDMTGYFLQPGNKWETLKKHSILLILHVKATLFIVLFGGGLCREIGLKMIHLSKLRLGFEQWWGVTKYIYSTTICSTVLWYL